MSNSRIFLTVAMVASFIGTANATNSNEPIQPILAAKIKNQG